MDYTGKRIWQQSAGDTDRNYADLCLKWDVVLNGPGSYGPWPDCQQKMRMNKWSERKITDLQRFCEEMNEGDLVILKVGTKEVFGVGQIIGKYQHIEEFNDVDGWELAHVRRVHWLWEYKTEPKSFASHALKFGDTTQLLDENKSRCVLRWMEELEIEKSDPQKSLIQLPEASFNIEFCSISDFLFDQGVADSSITSLLDQVSQFIRMAKWYSRSGTNISEYETVAHLVLPILRASGWTSQKMAVEFKMQNSRSRIDVALFDRLPREVENIGIVVEAKRLNASCLTRWALNQAERYASGAVNCKKIVLTDGIRYGVFRKSDEMGSSDGKFALVAYMNLLRLRDSYPMYQCKGLRGAILAMVPGINERRGSA